MMCRRVILDAIERLCAALQDMDRLSSLLEMGAVLGAAAWLLRGLGLQALYGIRASACVRAVVYNMLFRGLWEWGWRRGWDHSTPPTDRDRFRLSPCGGCFDQTLNGLASLTAMS